LSEEDKNKLIDYKSHWFWGSILDSKATYSQIALASLFINIFGLGSAFYIMTVYDRVMPNNAYSSLIALTIGMAIIIIFDFIVKLLRAYFIDIAGTKLDQKINNSIFKKILSHDNEFLTKSRGVAAVVREFEGVRDFFTTASMVAFIDLPFMFLFLFIIWSIAGPLALVPILIVPLVLGVSALIQPLLRRNADKNLKFQQDKSSTLSELLNNVETVRTVAGGSFLQDKWNTSVEEQSESAAKGRGISNFAVTFSQTGLQISQAAVVCYGVVLVGNLEITAGALIAVVILSGRVLSPLVQAGQLLTRLNHAIVAYSNVDKMMSGETRDETTKEFKATKLSNGQINVKDLDYIVEDMTILKQVNFSVNDGEKVGFVGNIGSGKTTLLRNIIGFLLPSSGSVNIGGYDIKNVPTPELRKSIGYCPQKVQLFTGTVYDNITAGYDDATEEDVIESATLSGAHEFIGKLPGGYSYVLQEAGGNLSGGQRQSIALARALIRKPKFLILDEPTSSMDGNLEQLIIKNITELEYNPTLIISTHRSSHLNQMDKIGIILDGKLVAFGPKDQILKQQTENNV
tara:strand:- start:4819 stop:6534 length:1716 start_codon:yes stop_codon:yes gene_type:complete